MRQENVKLTKLWIERFVIGLRLCPFAHISFYNDTIFYEESTSSKMSNCLEDLTEMVATMHASKPSVISNSFLIFEQQLTFHFMLLLKDKFDKSLEKEGLDTVFQTVVFHPEFQFADESFHASGNFSNRSPLPMIHILRVDEVSYAIEATENVDDIPLRNKKVLEDLNIRHISEVFDEVFMEKIRSFI